MIKIAVPTRGSVVEEQYGKCEMYTLYTINEKGKLGHIEFLASPNLCGCRTNISNSLQQRGVNVMLAGSMGEDAFNLLNSQGINVYRGCSGDVRKLLDLFLQGKIIDSGNSSYGNSNGMDCENS
jgi:predicted Fe-Mo cluster-binding NifX family protein